MRHGQTGAGKSGRFSLARVALTLAFTSAAVLSVANTAAIVGIPALSVPALGASFGAWQRAYLAREVAVRQRATEANVAGLEQLSRYIARGEPLELRAWRGFALVAQQRRQMPTARQIMLGAEGISRRDPAVEAWLLEDAARRNDAPATLARFDAILRVQPSLRATMLAQLQGVLANPQARAALAPYLNGNTPWASDFVQAAARGGRSVVPWADLVLTTNRLPDGPYDRDSYATVVTRLADEREYARLARLYPRLPGADAARLRSLGFSREATYPPVDWQLSSTSDVEALFAASPSRDGGVELVATARPLARGTVARKLVWVADSGGVLSWTVADSGGGSGAAATVSATCAGTTVTSDNLVGRRGKMALALPRQCDVADVRVDLVGGSGREDTMLSLKGMHLGSVE